ncbi:MAG: DUF3187 family protein [Acidobacteriota bacterium]
MFGRRASARLAILFLYLSLSVAAGPLAAEPRPRCRGEDSLGLFHYTSQGPFQGLRQSFTPQLGRLLHKGETEVKGNSSFSNLFARDNDFDTYLIDYETARVALGVRYGLTDRWALRIEADSVRRYGGELDRIVEATHDLLGVSQGGRQFLVADDVRLFVEGEPFESLSLDQGGAVGKSLGFGFENVAHCAEEGESKADVRRSPTGVPTTTWGVFFRVKDVENIPTARWQGDDVDVSGGVQSVWTAGRFVLTAGMSFTFFGSESLGGAELASHQVGALGAVEWRAGPRWSVVLQYLATEAALNRFPFDRPTNEVLLGVKTRWGPTLVEAAIVENVIVSPNGPDIGFHFGFGTRF